MIKETLKLLAPPILTSAYRKIRPKPVKKALPQETDDILFDGDDALFKELTQDARIYGEYGCGQSTNWILNKTSAKVVAVDTSEIWVNKVTQANVKNSHRLNIRHVNLGEVGAWGRPIDYSKRDFFDEYTDFIWKQPEKPDIVLVDGRFRVCCFLTCLKLANEGTRILFDDYIDRPFYHIVENHAPRLKVCGRQCLFTVPPKSEIDFDALNGDILAFRHVMD